MKAMLALSRILNSLQFYTLSRPPRFSILAKDSLEYIQFSNSLLFCHKINKLQRLYCKKVGIIKKKRDLKIDLEKPVCLKKACFEGIELRLFHRKFSSSPASEDEEYSKISNNVSTISPVDKPAQGTQPHPPKQQTSSKRTKKSRVPKINLALADEIKKVDQEFAHKKGAYEAIFPFPKSNLHNAYAIISSQLNDQHEVAFEYKHVSEAPACWQCSVKVAWPTTTQFTCLASSKSEAAHRASLNTLLWLQSMGKVNQKGEVELMVQMNKQAEKNAPVAEINLESKHLESIELIVNRYYEEVIKKDHIPAKEVDVDATETQTFSDSDDEENFKIDTLPIKRKKVLFPHVADQRDKNLLRRYEIVKSRRDELSAVLPIDKFKEQIVELVNNNSVVVIKGEPGCGKSTQVPQYLMEWHAAQGEATDCNIVVTQPRRISAISLAERVAYERDEQVGDVVGYHVRLNARHPRYKDGYILFCSTGLLVRKMIGDSGLSGVTHVIVDEAHERDTQVDFLLLLLKRALEVNPSLRVIIMSATINAELFTEFFNNCPSISIPGFTYPVQHYFFDDEMKKVLQRHGAKLENEDVDRPVVNIEALLGIVKWIDDNKPEGAILVFLPGWLEIRTVMGEIRALPNSGRFMVVPAHSKLSSEDQRRIFEKPQFGQRKVILSTNIAETSLTINDVVYVVDSGSLKEERVDSKSGLVCLDNQWASQANILQRRGRAGRVQPGESYHLFTEDKYNSLDEFPIPEINRIPLTRSVLDVKMHTKDENITQFLSCLPEPPRQESVTQAVRVLQSMGALDEDENLTALGKRIYKFPLDPYLSKALVHACLFKCVNPMLSIATLLSADYTIFENSLGMRTRIRQLKQQYSPSSDHIATARLYEEWEHIDRSNPDDARSDCDHKSIIYRSMDRTRQLRQLHAELLTAAKLIPGGENINDSLSPYNSFAPYEELLKSVLLTGLGKILISYKPIRKRGLVIRTMDHILAVISSESVNSKYKELPTPFLTYFKGISSLERRAVIVHESSFLSPVSVVLFLPGIMTLNSMANLEPGKSVISIHSRKPINIIVEQKAGEQLLHLRQVIWNVLEYLVENEGEPKDLEQYKRISLYRDDLVQILVNITTSHGAKIDFTESGELRTEPSYDRMRGV